MISFFGDCDKLGGTKHGKIVNTNPLWTKDKQISDMKEEISDIKAQEAEGFLSPRVKAAKMARKTKIQTTLRQIEESNPVGKIQGKDLDDIKKTADSFVEGVKNLEPSYYDEDMARQGKSNVNTSHLGHMAKHPCIRLKNVKEKEIAKSCNMKVENGMVSRDDMKRGIWLLERILGIEPDHTRLKYDVKPGQYIRKSSQVLVPELPADMVK